MAALQSAMHLVPGASYASMLHMLSLPRWSSSPPAPHNSVLLTAQCSKTDQLAICGIKGKCSAYAQNYP